MPDEYIMYLSEIEERTTCLADGILPLKEAKWSTALSACGRLGTNVTLLQLYSTEQERLVTDL